MLGPSNPLCHLNNIHSSVVRLQLLFDDVFYIYQLGFCFVPILSTNVKREFGGAFF